MGEKASSGRMATIDRWLVGLTRLSTPSVIGRLAVGVVDEHGDVSLEFGERSQRGLV